MNFIEFSPTNLFAMDGVEFPTHLCEIRDGDVLRMSQALDIIVAFHNGNLIARWDGMQKDWRAASVESIGDDHND